jgi:hypothetical protein
LLGYDIHLTDPFQFIICYIYHTLARQYVIWATHSIVKYSVKKAKTRCDSGVAKQTQMLFPHTDTGLLCCHDLQSDTCQLTWKCEASCI